MKQIYIIGGGAAGLFAASCLSANSNYQVTILEKNNRVGKKLLLTGNGKCNLTNETIDIHCYNHQEAFEMIQRFDSHATIDYFNKLGLLVKKDNEGRYYPYSESANSVLDTLRNQIHKNNIKELVDVEIISIDYQNQKYILTDAKNNDYRADILIMATGGKSYYPSTNSYALARLLNHTITPLKPSLIGFKVQENVASLQNLRCKAEVSLIANHKLIAKDQGEIIFKKDGLSGIVMFQMSSYYNRYDSNTYSFQLDLMPEYSKSELISLLERKNVPYEQLLDGIFLKMIATYIYKQTKEKKINFLVQTIKHLTFTIQSTYDFTNAQVTSGGVNLNEINLETMESKKFKNLYLIGEMLDVDGICGGYNLQFAWSSAALCANHIKKG